MSINYCIKLYYYTFFWRRCIVYCPVSLYKAKYVGDAMGLSITNMGKLFYRAKNVLNRSKHVLIIFVLNYWLKSSTKADIVYLYIVAYKSISPNSFS